MAPAAMDVLQPLSTNHIPSAGSSSKAGLSAPPPPPPPPPNKVRILWRGSLILPDGVPLPGLSIVSTHLPSSSSSGSSHGAGNDRSPRTRIRTSDVFGTPITPVEETIPVLPDSDGNDSGREGRQLVKEEDEAESDLTLAIEMLRHAPLSVRASPSSSTSTAETKKRAAKGSSSSADGADLLDRWVVSSSTSLSLDSAHWSTIDYLQRVLLPPTTDPPRVTMTLSPPLQDHVPHANAGVGAGKRLLAPAAPFDVFSSAPNEFAIVPIVVPLPPPETVGDASSSLSSSSSIRRGKAVAQPVRLALAQRRRRSSPFSTLGLAPALSLRGSAAATGIATSTAAATASAVAAASASASATATVTAAAAALNATPTTERGLSATKKRMAVAARNRTVTSSSAGTIVKAGAPPPPPPSLAPRFAESQMAMDVDGPAPALGKSQSVPAQGTALATSTVPPRTLLRQQIKRLARYALLARGMMDSSSSSSSMKNGTAQQSHSQSQLSSQQAQAQVHPAAAIADEYGPCLKAIVAATEAAFKPEVDAHPAGTPFPLDLPRIAACVQAYVQLYAPPLPRAMPLPGSGSGNGSGMGG
ncbi:hypothetical protein OC835_004152 [Tilletia horrida]|nr:hypothetical protein OC835_004152 [Tilletia horrida]